jgi:hypothetical protein
VIERFFAGTEGLDGFGEALASEVLDGRLAGSGVIRRILAYPGVVWFLGFEVAGPGRLGYYWTGWRCTG